MYPQYQDRLAPSFRESFPWGWIVAENALYLALWVAAGWLVWPLQWQGWPVATLAWAAIVLVCQVLLKKHNCSGCSYYGKSCHLGWGRLTKAMFKPDCGDPRTGMRLALFYIVAPPLFLVAGILVGLFAEVGTLHWVVLGVYVALNALSFPVRIKGCRVCAMRLVCAGSAAKRA